ncbi:DUF2142 domain-containing protein [Thomasclavelia ramosa]|uniref:DUF2142 domain-containing protein n=1 Tax=Thomasclavelia ramosa TaxID=1547 RepID=UPI00191D17AD|nr:DUF2142 domain-containing protein [Thomasclavelia ramosa]MCR1956902.1 DUF2142 domain-containing protein [Thomasclavelia ramosa]QQV05352.1 DUF2142 domain-containing protein [Thomasclavelia ramosa]
MKNIIVEERVYKLFVVVALLFGIIIMFLVPPFQVPDEDSHFKKAYVMSGGQIVPEKIDGVVGYYIPKELSDTINSLTSSVVGDRDKKSSYSALVLDDRTPITYNNVEFQNFSTANSNFIAHLVPTIGILIGKVFAKITQGGNASVTYLLYFARFANLMLFVSMVGFAIKNTPILKRTMMLVGLMPMSIFLGASTSYDCLIISGLFLIISYIFRLIFDEKYALEKHNMIILAILGSIIGVIKPNYLLIFLLLLFIPKYKFKNSKELIKTGAIFALILVSGYLVLKLPYFFMKTTTLATSDGNGEVSLNAQQWSYVLSNPLAFFKAAYKTLADGMNYYICTTVATFGLIDTYVPTLISYLYLGLITLMGVVEMSRTEYKVNWIIRVFSIFVFVAVILSTFFAMYMSWTPMELGVGSATVTGVQGRYFIPVLFLPMIIFQNKQLTKNKITNGVMEIYENYYFVFVLGLLFVCSAFILIRFWS